MPISRFKLDPRLRHLYGAAAMLVLVVGSVSVLVRSFAHTLARNSDVIQASEFAASLSPSDPLARYRYAADLERTFDLDAIPRSLAEYEGAVAAAPHNFVYWIGLGQARERDGNRAAAELAYRRALELAPSYARTRWALGNNLVRQGKVDEGVALIRRAVEQEAAYAAPAVTATMQAFDGDTQKVLDSLGTSAAALAELAKYLVNDGRSGEGLAVWRSIKIDPSIAAVKDAGTVIRRRLIEAKQFRNAAEISASLEPDEQKRPMIGAIANGGFEAGVTAQNADHFDWQVGNAYPIFGLSDNQAKEGKFSLIVRFSTPSRLDYEAPKRNVAVEPGKSYNLSIWYRSDLTTRAEFRWEVLSATDDRRISLSDLMAHQIGWTELTTSVKVPADSDGIVIRLVREKCDSAACTVSGNIWFDDARLTPIN